jgi:hypothetical protein
MDDVLAMIIELRAELRAELAKRDETIARLSLRLGWLAAHWIETDDEGEPRPPGEWAPLKQAAHEAGRSEAWLLLKRKCGAVRQCRDGGRILVEMGSVRAAIGALDGAEKACR